VYFGHRDTSGEGQTNGIVNMKCVSKQSSCDRRAAVLFAAALTASGALVDNNYVYGEATRDGTGRYYMGYEIAQVMGHRGADWLEPADRGRRTFWELREPSIGRAGMRPTFSPGLETSRRQPR
jgi:hypothetical protein